jgi:hypothetical protein
MDFTQLAYLDDEGNPVSICIGTEDNFMIPTVVCYNSELKEWSAGQEALNKGRLEKSCLYKELPAMFKSEDKEKTAEVMLAYMSYLLKIAVNYCNGRLIKNILITVEEVTPEVIEGLTKTFTTLGYETEDIKIISHSESFVYYVLNQNRDIWINNVYFLNFDKHGFTARRLNVIKGKPPYVADVSIENLNDLISLKMLNQNAQAVDQILADYMEEKMKKYVVSGVYLSGEGFYAEGWDKTLSVMCRNRRVFKGSNLLVKGAVYGAKEFFYIASLEQYLISCKGRTRVKVTMEVKHKERDSFVTLSNIGDYWYQARSKVECILEKPAEAVFEIHDIMNHRNEKFKIDLTEFPQRPSKTTRIEVNFRYVTENRFEIEIKDLGFGEFFKSSGKSVKKGITIE